MIILETSLGTKEVSIEQAIRYKSITKSVSIKQGEDITSHPLFDEFNKAFPVVRKSEFKPSTKIKYKKDRILKNFPKASKIGTIEIKKGDLTEMDIICPFCKNKEDHKHCSPNGNCAFMARAVECANDLDSHYLVMRYILQNKKSSYARQPTCISPIRYWYTTGDKTYRYYDSFYFTSRYPNSEIIP